MPHRGVLDLMDQTDRLLDKLVRDLSEELDKLAIRKLKACASNARSTNVEARRMLERTGHETKT